MKKNLLLTLIMIITALTIIACGTQSSSTSTQSEPKVEVEAETNENEQVADITINDQLGETTVAVNPQKVVVFDFGVLDSLDKLGVEIAGVPQQNLPPHLEKYSDANYVNVGSLKEPDFEKIAEMNPDLIIISGRQLEVADELKKIAPTIFLGVDTKNYFESFTTNMETIAKIFAKEAEVTEELAKIETMITDVREKVTASGANGLIILSNEGNINAYGKGSRFGIIHDVLGVTPVDENIEVSTHGMNVSFEYVVEKDPEYLFVVDRNAAVSGQPGAKQSIENELIQKTKAYQNNRIIYLDPNYWYLAGGGLISVTEMIKAIDEAIQ